MNLYEGIKIVILGLLGYFGYTFVKKSNVLDAVSEGTKETVQAVQNGAQAIGSTIYDNIINPNAGYIEIPHADIRVDDLKNKFYSWGLYRIETESDFRAVWTLTESHAFNIITFKRSFLSASSENILFQMVSQNKSKYPKFVFKYFSKL
jgi:hypothetical protein